MTDTKYIKELEKALSFMCEMYLICKDSFGSYKDDGSDPRENKYGDLWFHFPMIQGTGNQIAVKKISEILDAHGNRLRPSISLREMSEIIQNKYNTKDKFNAEIKKVVEK